jgi:integrase
MAKTKVIPMQTDEEVRAEIARLRALTSWTAADVASFLLEPGKAETQYADPERDGLQHVLYDNGSRRWRYRYKLNGARKYIKYGKYGVPSRILVSYEEVKKRWTQDHAKFERGEDPKPEKPKPEEKKEEHTFRQLVTRWANTSYVDFGLVGRKSREKVLQELEGTITEDLWGKPTGEIAVRHIHAVLDPMKERNAYKYAAKVHGYLTRIAKFARTRVIPFDREIFEVIKVPVAPQDAVKKFKLGSAVRHLTLEQAKYVWHEIRAASSSPYIWHLICLELVLGLRQGEICGMLRQEIDLKNAILTIPWTRIKTRSRSRKKTKAETERPHVLPIPAIAMDIFRDALKGRDLKPGDAVFPAPRKGLKLKPGDAVLPAPKPLATRDVNAILQGIFRRNKLPGVPRFTTHTLRRTVITQVRVVGNRDRLADAAAYMHHVIDHAVLKSDPMAVVGGGNAITDSSYDENKREEHGYMAEKKIALDAWGAFIDDLVGHSASKALKLVA